VSLKLPDAEKQNTVYDLPVCQARASDYHFLKEDLLLNLFEDFQGDTSNGKCLLILDGRVSHC